MLEVKRLSDKLSKDLEAIVDFGIKIGEQSSRGLIEDLHGQRLQAVNLIFIQNISFMRYGVLHLIL